MAKDNKTGKYGYINVYGDFVIDAQFDSATNFYGEGFDAVAVVNEDTIINEKGETLFTIKKAQE